MRAGRGPSAGSSRFEGPGSLCAPQQPWPSLQGLSEAQARPTAAQPPPPAAAARSPPPPIPSPLLPLLQPGLEHWPAQRARSRASAPACGLRAAPVRSSCRCRRSRRRRSRRQAALAAAACGWCRPCSWRSPTHVGAGAPSGCVVAPPSAACNPLRCCAQLPALLTAPPAFTPLQAGRARWWRRQCGAAVRCWACAPHVRSLQNLAFGRQQGCGPLAGAAADCCREAMHPLCRRGGAAEPAGAARGGERGGGGCWAAILQGGGMDDVQIELQQGQ